MKLLTLPLTALPAWFLLLSIVAGWAAPAMAAPGLAGVQTVPNVTVELKGVSVARALGEIFQGLPFEYRLRTGVPAVSITLSLRNRPLTEALDALLRASDRTAALVWSFDARPGGKGIFYIDREQISVSDDGLRKELNITRGRAVRALELLFQKIGAPFRVSSGVTDVPLSLQLRPRQWEEAALALLIEASRSAPGLAFSRSQGWNILHAPERDASPAVNVRLGRAHKVAARQGPLRTLLSDLLAGAGLQFRIDDEVSDPLVSLDPSAATFRGALESLLAQASAAGGPVTYRVDGEVLWIEPGAAAAATELLSRLLTPADRRVAISGTYSLRQLVRRIERVSGVSVAVAGGAPDVMLTLEIDEPSAARALQAVADAASRLAPRLVLVKESPQAFRLQIGPADPRRQ